MSARVNTRKSNWGKVVNTGMGNFLNPPSHPEHEWSIQSIYGHSFSMSLSAAIKSEYLDDEARNEAKRILNEWHPLPIDDIEVYYWMCQAIGYFAGCYQSSDGSWNADKLHIDPKLNAIENQNQHAGVHLIRKYYPKFNLTDKILLDAYWGTRK